MVNLSESLGYRWVTVLVLSKKQPLLTCDVQSWSWSVHFRREHVVVELKICTARTVVSQNCKVASRFSA